MLSASCSIGDNQNVIETHELSVFLAQVANEMESEYRRIRRRTAEDPGTAGDEGEANWAALLSDWLPPDLLVTTKGRILGADGSMSPQLDVIVLSSDYPRKLRDKKIYLAGGVVAAFECKNTVRKRHLEALFATAAAINSMEAHPHAENLYRDSYPPILFGLLAHSHDFGAGDAAAKVDSEISRLHSMAAHPRDVPAVLCVSDLHTWRHHRMLEGPAVEPSVADIRNGTARSTSNFARWMDLGSIIKVPLPESLRKFFTRPNPVAELLLCILEHLSLQDPRKRRLASYFHSVNPPSLLTFVSQREWSIEEAYSESMVSRLRSDEWWDEERWDPANDWDLF